MPKVSIISAVYNVEKYLKRSLDCLINQTLKDIEIILINDCSTDKSLSIMKEYASRDERIKIIDLKENSGAAVARNKGLEIATGEYLGFIDPDDAIDLNYYEELYKAAKKQNADLAKCALKIIHPDGRFVITNFNQNFAKDKYSFMIEWTTAIYKKEIIDKYKIKFPSECRKGQDSTFQVRFIFKAKKLAIINNVLYYYYKREGSLHSNNIPPKSVKSALTAISYMLKEANDSELYNNSQTKYLDVFKMYYNAMFFTLFQSKKYESKMYCAKAIIDQFYTCKCIEEFKKVYLYEWILKFIEKNDVKGLAKAFMQYSSEKEMERKPKKWYKFIFSSEYDINKYGKKIIYICGFKIRVNANKTKLKFKELVQRVEQLEKEQFSIKEDTCREISNLKRKLTYLTSKYCPIERREEYLKDWYCDLMNENLDLSNPKTYNEKIQWMKLYDSTPTKTRLADKYQVRDYVKEKIGEQYLIPLLGVWDSFDDIDFDKLPRQFVLKCNHGCGCNIIVKDKFNFDIEEARKKFNTWLNIDYSNLGFELHYSAIPRKIIAEEFIQNAENELYDYKVWCFDGKAYYVQFLSERNTDGLKMAFYDRNWNKQNFVYSVPMDTKNNKKPENLELLLELAEKLSSGFNHVRVDFYITNDNKIYFGEMTFTSCNGISEWRPKEADLMLGNMIDLNRVNTNV